MKNLLFAIAFLAFVSCNTKNESVSEKETDAQETDHNMHGEPKQDVKEQVIQEEISEEEIKKYQSIEAGMANKIVESYLEIKEALVQTNSLEAKKAAEKIHKELSTNKNEGIDIFKEDVEHIASTESVQHQREHFNTLSKHVYTLVKANDANNSTLYRQYCPMAFDNKGAFWLSSSEDIKNPYFGDKMLKCGRVEETIN